MSSINTPFRIGRLFSQVAGFYPDKAPVAVPATGGTTLTPPSWAKTYGDAAPRYDCSDVASLSTALRACLRVSAWTFHLKYAVDTYDGQTNKVVSTETQTLSVVAGGNTGNSEETDEAKSLGRLAVTPYWSPWVNIAGLSFGSQGGISRADSTGGSLLFLGMAVNKGAKDPRFPYLLTFQILDTFPITLYGQATFLQLNVLGDVDPSNGTGGPGSFVPGLTFLGKTWNMQGYSPSIYNPDPKSSYTQYTYPVTLDIKEESYFSWGGRYDMSTGQPAAAG